MDWLPESLQPLLDWPYAPTVIQALVLVLVAVLSSWLSHKILRRVVTPLVRASPMKWDDALLVRGVYSRLAHVVPALVLYLGCAAIPGLPQVLVTVVRHVAAAYVVLTVALALGDLLDAGNDLYEGRGPHARERPIKGYLQVAKIVVFVVAFVLIVATLVDESPLLLLSGFGAMSAIMLLVFKDSILSLVASVQLASNDMLRLGDWIEIPTLGADGTVIDIALNTVKVQNWDLTITTVPTYRLVSDSFKNWRGMRESGGRRIKRALYIDQGSVRFMTAAELDALSRTAPIGDYLADMKREMEADGRPARTDLPSDDLREVTNLGTFRHYVEAYLRASTRLRQDMDLMVRHLAPEPTGLPLEIWCFTKTTIMTEYETIQADIFDHLIAILPEFGLRLFQQPGGADFTRAMAEGGKAAAQSPLP
ncbi:mechanosensitive ion channel family protein [Lysobacter cavernae]|uniref:Mechanosensitive ion channel family protein n=1 Tax=Lysobacter cavernae TaxID=1685901 RepID=A0ABV7RTJ5_9GAMM